MRSKSSPQPRPVHRAGRARGRSVQRHRVLSVFAFQRLDIDRRAERAANGESAQVNQNLFTRALHPHSCERDMAEGERTARYGAHYRLRLSMSTLSPMHSPNNRGLLRDPISEVRLSHGPFGSYPLNLAVAEFNQ